MSQESQVFAEKWHWNYELVDPVDILAGSGFKIVLVTFGNENFHVVIK